MAFKRTLAQRLFNISRISHQTLTTCRITSSAVAAIDPVDESIFRRFLQRRPLYQSSTAVPELLSLPTGGKLTARLRGMDIVRDRIRLDGLSPPATVMDSPDGKTTMEDARKLLKVAQLEMVKSKLRRIEKNCVLKAIQGLMPVPIAHSGDPRRKELEELEQQKSIIDKKAESMVRRELWCGLGYLVIQTAAFMRLTFWELSWDVMEPICFYVTSMYFMAGYAFFLRTAKEPSFEGFFQSRFSAKQKKLMKVNNFDLGRYSELRKACYPYSWPREQIFSFTPSKSNNNSESMENVPFAEDYNLR